MQLNKDNKQLLGYTAIAINQVIILDNLFTDKGADRNEQQIEVNLRKYKNEMVQVGLLDLVNQCQSVKSTVEKMKLVKKELEIKSSYLKDLLQQAIEQY